MPLGLTYQHNMKAHNHAHHQHLLTTVQRRNKRKRQHTFIKAKRQKYQHSPNAKSKAHILADAQQDYWRDKPFEMDDDELIKAVKKSRVQATDVVRMINDYNALIGPNVGTCVCALCNDFGTERDGVFWNNARERLGVHYNVGCSNDAWSALSVLEKRF